MNQCMYLLFAVGLVIWQYPLFYGSFCAVRNRFYIKRNLKAITGSSVFRKRSRLGRHIEMVITSAEAEELFVSLENFYLFSLLLGGGSFFAVYLAAGLTAAVFCGLFTASLPYDVIALRLHGKRTARSREGDILIQELLNCYKISGFNIKEAVEMTSAGLENAPGAKKVMLQLAKGLQKAAGAEEVERRLATFRYSIDTAWGSALATNIYFAYLYGIRIDSALEDLLQSMARSRTVIEHGKRENNEARLMLKYLAPVSYLLTVLLACRFFDFTLAKYFKYQLGTALGLQWFVIMIVLYGASLLLSEFLSKEKMDI